LIIWNQPRIGAVESVRSTHLALLQLSDTQSNWNVGARTGCKFKKGETLPTSCETGGVSFYLFLSPLDISLITYKYMEQCNGGLKCDRASGTGVPPATLAEFTFTGDLDWYDISNVDGSNLPVSITNSKKCPAPACKTDINKSCPAARKLYLSSSAFVAQD